MEVSPARGRGEAYRRPRRDVKEKTARYSIAEADFARCRSTNFWILPVDVLGSTPKITRLGALKRARSSRQWSMIACSVQVAPGFSSTKAHGDSPHFGSGCATTAAASTAGWR